MFSEGASASCGSVTVIARSNTDRFLARCTCGCLHLVWDSASLSLLADDLEQLLDHPPQADQAVAALFEMREDPYGGYQVWVGAGGVRVTEHEMRDMVVLLHQGAAQLKAATVSQSGLRTGTSQPGGGELPN